MATYAIGDVQGCFDELRRLLREVGFDLEKDRLWFVGDLVNRGPKSLEVLRFVRGLGERAVVVLGNHDLHLVTQHEGFERPRKDDTFQDVLRAPDRKALVDWLRTRPMMHVEGGYAMVHAGLLPQWSIEEALALGKEVERALAARDYREFLRNMYGSQPDAWSDSLAGWDRLRVIVNAMTRLRFCTPGGKMEFRAKAAKPPPGFAAWFEYRKEKETIVCGHWSALGLKMTAKLAALDSGCVWGGSLSALRLEDRALYQVPCAGHQPIGGEA
ncbi:MAG: bis(5'-nucleosyl)-tetraphosphatase (symmetrical) [Betaproteobacteria bacterium RIFCSPLOWO2_12_FULL_65_14]|nr:MAG: bis(5'-nucleosyl)-tetraphosphatase (symmetrical) [Betaproteobacteria bacterium RIFCSPLOWO2_12_FULL_65_14]